MFFNAWNFYISVGAIFWTVILAYFFGGYDFLLDLSVEHRNELERDKFLCEKSFERWKATLVLERREIEEVIMVRNVFDELDRLFNTVEKLLFMIYFLSDNLLSNWIHLLFSFLLYCF